MTIIEAIKIVLNEEHQSMNSKEIYNRIIEKELYKFGAKNPHGIVNGILRSHCIGIDFPTASPVKHFKVDKKINNKNYYLINDSKQNLKISETITEDGYIEEDLLPEEKMVNAFEEHKAIIKNQLITYMVETNPAFFEQIVIQLLIRMGYGYDEDSGIVVGRPKDGGIDGIINEDKLGLDKIYIQAKRYASSNGVGSPDLQRFVGAMENIKKGVFITTSFFTKPAVRYIEKQQQKNIKLIDGEMLAELMVRYEIGVMSKKSFKTYKIDIDYFSEN